VTSSKDWPCSPKSGRAAGLFLPEKAPEALESRRAQASEVSELESGGASELSGGTGRGLVILP